jgi:hypothetical protein
MSPNKTMSPNKKKKTKANKPDKRGYTARGADGNLEPNYGMDYMGKAAVDPMDVMIAAALRATGDEYNRRHGKTNMPTERIEITDAGEGLRVFAPAGENTIAISLDMDGDEDYSDMPNIFGNKKPAAATTVPEEPAEAPSSEWTMPATCRHCMETPCVLTQVDEALDPNKCLYEYLMWQGEDMVDNGHTNREVRYQLYRTASRFRHGILGAGNRKELPTCITGDIRDAFPNPGGNYTGFARGFLNN